MTLRSETAPGIATDGDNRPINLRPLAWDTTFFGRKMGVLDLLEPETSRSAVATVAQAIRRALYRATDEGYDHLILRLPAEHTNAIRAAELAGMRLVDVAVDLIARLAGPRGATFVGPSIRPASQQDVAALQEIAGDSFALSRFAADPFFSADEVTAFYRQWTANLCAGLADQVFVAEASDEIAGFASCALLHNGRGRIPLFATSEAHRQQGIGRALVDTSLRWFAAAGVREVFVKTQAANYPALALYQGRGFRVALAEVVLSTCLNGPDDR